MNIEKVRIADIEISPDIMPRRYTDWDTSLEYSAAYEAGETLPPIVVFADDERPGRYWLADGWHRLDAQRASRAEGEPEEDDDYGDLIASAKDPTEVEAEIHPGGKIAAMLYAASANITHGRRRDRWDSIAAAKVAIRALTLQNPERRPTVEAVKTTARVGTDIAQRAFQEIAREAEAEVAALPPKDPRGGARVREGFVPRGTNDAYPDLDENGMLPVVSLDGADVAETGKPIAEKAPEMVKAIVTNAFAAGPSPRHRSVMHEHKARIQSDAFDRLWGDIHQALAPPPEEAAESWLIANRVGDLAEKLEETARTITAYAARVRAAKPERLPLVTVAGADDGGAS